jgi:hypothetical protein
MGEHQGLFLSQLRSKITQLEQQLGDGDETSIRRLSVTYDILVYLVALVSSS